MLGTARKIMLYLPGILIGGRGTMSQTAGGGRRLEEDGESASSRRQPFLRGEDESRDGSVRGEENRSSPILVDYLYTYGTASISNPPMSNPGNRCIPGIRTYTENVSSGRDCGWWEALWCNQHDRITDTDFVARANDVDKFPHAKMSTLVLRLRDDSVHEYIWKECKDSENVGQYDYQSWPATDRQEFLSLFGINLGDVIAHWLGSYVTRLMEVPESIRGPLLEYTPVTACGYIPTMDQMGDCVRSYFQATGFSGLDPSNWEPFALMFHEYDSDISDGKDLDTMYVLKNDENTTRRKCIISFMAATGVDDALDLFENSGYTEYCGRGGVHVGMRDKLWGITHDDQYSEIIKPALETCHEVTCVGQSLAGTLCNILTMCANTGPENLRAAAAAAASSNDAASIGADAYDDYYSLAWNKR